MSLLSFPYPFKDWGRLLCILFGTVLANTQRLTPGKGVSENMCTFRHNGQVVDKKYRKLMNCSGITEGRMLWWEKPLGLLNC